MPDDLEELRETHNDIPALDDVEESLTNAETHRRLAGVRSATARGKIAAKAGLTSGAFLSLYLIFLKLPLTSVGVDIRYVTDLFDPFVALFILGFGLGWTALGAFNIWGAWSFYRLRRLQNSSARRPAVHFIRGVILTMTGLSVAAVAIAYVFFFGL